GGQITAMGTTGGVIGYLYEGLKPTLHYTAFANAAAGSSDYDVLKPIPGTIEGIHYLQGETHGFYVTDKGKQSPIRTTDRVHIEETGLGEYAVQLNGSKDWLRYGVNVSEAGDYM